jgi:FkbM family methyltransferase
MFVDIGSALGYYSILVKKVAPWFRVISVDPNPHFHERHTRTVELNGLVEGDIELVKRAVYSRSGYVDFSNRDFSSFVCSRLSHDESNRDGVIQVEAVTVGELVESIKCHVDLMKVDIQGTELEVFRYSDISTLSKNVSNIIVGTHGKSVHSELIKILSKSYRIAYEDESPVHQPDGIIVAHSRRRRY